MSESGHRSSACWEKNAQIIVSRKPVGMLSVSEGYETDGQVKASFPSAIKVLL